MDTYMACCYTHKYIFCMQASLTPRHCFILFYFRATLSRENPNSRKEPNPLGAKRPRAGNVSLRFSASKLSVWHDEIVRARSVLLHNSKMATIVSLDLFLGAAMLLSL